MKRLQLVLFAVSLVSPAYAASTLFSNSSTGEVGIGTTSPAGTLDVEGGSAAASTNGTPINLEAQSAGSGNQNGGNIILMPGAATGTGTPGYVGIGTTTPGQELEVHGSSRFGGNVASYATTYISNGGLNTSVDTGNFIIWTNAGNTGYEVSIGQAVPGGGSIGHDMVFSTAYNTTWAEKMRLTYAGNFGIGNTSPSYLLHVGSSSASGVVAELQNSSGACTHSLGASTETVSCSSDMRLKDDIGDSESGLPWLDDMRIRDFTIKATGERKTGVIAQEIMHSHPDMVHENDEGYYSVDEPNPWKIIKAVQELKDENDNLKLNHDNQAKTIDELRREFEICKEAHP
jgi:trimeric autotransporter adhesin